MNMKRPNSFYKTKAWRTCREAILVRDHYLCQVCLKKGFLTPATIVHHIEHLSDNPDRAYDEDNLESVCAPCHNRLHPEKGERKKVEPKRRARVIRSEPNEEFI